MTTGKVLGMFILVADNPGVDVVQGENKSNVCATYQGISLRNGAPSAAWTLELGYESACHTEAIQKPN